MPIHGFHVPQQFKQDNAACHWTQVAQHWLVNSDDEAATFQPT